jgi:hypothetical protein
MTLPHWLRIAQNVWRALFGLRRSDISTDTGRHIPHGPELTGEPSGYVEPPLPPHEGWPGGYGDPDYIPPRDKP